MVLANSLFSWARKDSVALSAGKVVDWVDAVAPGVGIRATVPNHVFTQPTDAVRIATPSASSVTKFRGQIAGKFLGGQGYTSSAGEGEWRFVRDGTPCVAIAIGAARNGTVFRVFDTFQAATPYHELLISAVTPGDMRSRVNNGAGFILSTTSAAGAAADEPFYTYQTYSEAASPKQTFYLNRTLIGNTAPSGAPGAGAGVTLSFGGATTGSPGTFELMELMFAKDVSASLRATIDRYVALQYPVFGP